MIHNINPSLLTRAVKVVLVGAGGTGSHVLRRLANMHLAMVELGHPEGLDVLVVDPDTVSKTNVGRQNFWPSDVGQPKAEILVNRCNVLMQTGWQAEIAKVTDDSRFNSQPDIVIGCVDNRKGKWCWARSSVRASNVKIVCLTSQTSTLTSSTGRWMLQTIRQAAVWLKRWRNNLCSSTTRWRMRLATCCGSFFVMDGSRITANSSTSSQGA